MKAIAIFNNKGGVGKTTLLCNLSSFFQFQDKRVLVIDADPQCNASTYLLEEDDYLRILVDDKSTIYNIFQPVKEGTGYLDKEDIPIHESAGFYVDVIVGDPKLSLLEDLLSQDWVSCKGGESRGLRTTLILYDLLNKIKDDYDYVFFDVGPSLGAINRVVLMACDFFIMPMSTDIFSIQAINNIAESVRNWKSDFNRGLSDYSSKEHKEFLIEGNPVSIKLSFLGYVLQQYVAKTVSGEVRPVKAYERIIEQVPEKIRVELADLYNERVADYLRLGNIPNFNSLIPLSQMANKPIFKLVGGDGVVGAHFSKVKEYGDVIKEIANNITRNIELYD